MAISLQADATLPQGYISIDNQRVASFSTTGGLSATLAANTVNTQSINNNSVTSTKLAYDNGPFNFRNKIINGGFDIWQRGTNFPNIGPGIYTADRWSTGTTTAPSNKNISRQTLNLTDLPATEAGLAYYCRMSHGSTAVPLNGADVAINQAIELNVTGNASPLEAGRQYTLSFYARCNSPETFAAGTQFRNLANDGTTGIVTGQTLLVSATPSWARYSMTFTMPTPSSGNTCLIVTVRNSSVPNGVNIDITGIQLEEGPVATPFEQRPITTELDLCHRYYWRPAGGLGVSVASQANVVNFVIPFPSRMRIAPLVEGANDPPRIGTTETQVGMSCQAVNGYNVTATAFNADF